MVDRAERLAGRKSLDGVGRLGIQPVDEEFQGKHVHIGDDGVLTVDGEVIDYVRFPDGRYGSHRTAYESYESPAALARSIIEKGLTKGG